jgi:hypothetical protein
MSSNLYFQKSTVLVRNSSQDGKHHSWDTVILLVSPLPVFSSLHSIPWCSRVITFRGIFLIWPVSLSFTMTSSTYLHVLCISVFLSFFFVCHGLGVYSRFSVIERSIFKCLGNVQVLILLVVLWDLNLRHYQYLSLLSLFLYFPYLVFILSIFCFILSIFCFILSISFSSVWYLCFVFSLV